MKQLVIFFCFLFTYIVKIIFNHYIFLSPKYLAQLAHLLVQCILLKPPPLYISGFTIRSLCHLFYHILLIFNLFSSSLITKTMISHHRSSSQNKLESCKVFQRFYKSRRRHFSKSYSQHIDRVDFLGSLEGPYLHSLNIRKF